jgi:hypothetical protein
VAHLGASVMAGSLVSYANPPVHPSIFPPPLGSTCMIDKISKRRGRTSPSAGKSQDKRRYDTKPGSSGTQSLAMESFDMWEKADHYKKIGKLTAETANSEPSSSFERTSTWIRRLHRVIVNPKCQHIDHTNREDRFHA